MSEEQKAEVPVEEPQLKNNEEEIQNEINQNYEEKQDQIQQMEESQNSEETDQHTGDAKVDPLKTKSDSDNESEKSDLFDDLAHTESTPTEQGGSFMDNTFDNDLFISVSHPKKHVESMETYISYKLTTKTTRSTFDDSEYEVYRRYQDFLWLRSKLETEHPTNLIPPLPSKFVMKSVMDRFSAEFINTRCQALHNFMQRLSDHPVLSCNEHLKIFLTAKAPDLASVRKQSGEGFMSRMSGSVKSLAGSGVIKLKEHDPLLVAENERVTDFGEKMSVLIRIVERIMEEKKAFVDELQEFAPTFSAWAASEDVISPLLTSLSSCIESCAKSAENNATAQEMSFLPPLREYHLYSDVVKALMKKRDMTQANYERITDEEERKKEERANLPHSDQSYSLGAMMGRNASDVREQKEKKLDQQIEELSKKREEANNQLEVCNTDLRADLERWSLNKTIDIAHAFDQHAASQILYHQECIEAWESVLPQLQEGEIEST